MKNKRPSNFTLLIPVAAILFFVFIWSGVVNLSENGTEHSVTITGKRSTTGTQSRTYFTFQAEGKTHEVPHTVRHKVGDSIDVIVLGNQAVEGKKSDSTFILMVRDIGTLYFWLILIVAIILPLYRWLSYLPDKAFAWIPSRHTKRKGRKRGR